VIDHPIPLTQPQVGQAGSRIFPNAEGSAKIFGVFRVKNHDFTPKSIFFPILGGRAPGAPPPPPPESVPVLMSPKVT
jgi:hypothetical protein